ncbi:CASC3/Barentsz eIF4AIII binding-domain-containing protein [Aspergillus californicus]
MGPRRHNIGASRRKRREDEGEDEGSVDGELEDDSLSEGSVISQQDLDDADAEGSDESEDENTSVDGPNNPQVNGRVPKGPQEPRRRSASPQKASLATAISDTDTMLNGLKISDEGKGVMEIHFDDLRGDLDQIGRTPSAPPTEPTREPFTERKRRDIEKAAKEKSEDPTAVPMRGSFFLHDKRSTDTGANGHKFGNKLKSRPYGLIVDGNTRRKADITTEGLWTHDLHDTVAGDDFPAPKHSHTAGGASTFPHSNLSTTVPTAPGTATPPNRSFSSTVVVGNVPVILFLPGMNSPVSVPVSKKQHTRLPHHRPPLRRDKPVRISLPGKTVKYMFPAIDRSFIFIPRAQRPNQQSYRGRGRGGFYTGRRSSFYASSTYTPSVALSRRSSFGKPPSLDGYHSPAASVLSRQTVITTENGKPIVRLPPRPPGVNPSAAAAPVPMGINHPPPQTHPQQPIWRENRPTPIPMHQPRPQKAVSLADIETPVSFPINPPQTQQEQPFHHQVPMPGNGPHYGPDLPANYPPSAHTAATPLSQIPERAVHAPPFQSYGYQQNQPYYLPPYQPGPVYYPVSGTDYAPYNNGGSGPGAPFPSGQSVPYMMPGTYTPAEPSSQAGTVVHEERGTVYYLDASQMYPGSTFGVPPAPADGVSGMVGVMTPGATYYYPSPQGAYYTSQ